MARPGCAEQAVLSVCCPTYTLPQRRFQSRHLAPQLHAVKNRVIHSTKDYRLSPIFLTPFCSYADSFDRAPD